MGAGIRTGFLVGLWRGHQQELSANLLVVPLPTVLPGYLELPLCLTPRDKPLLG
jgi:hypothetical protein